MAMEYDVSIGGSDVVSEVDRLWNVVYFCNGNTIGQTTGELDDGLFTHTVDENVARSIAEDAGAQPILPVVVMCKPTQRGFDTS